MRVIAGEFRSRLLKSVPGTDTRPTPDRLRESLFSILQPQLEGAVFLDAYSGTGAVGIEALSRGAREAIFIESSSTALRVLQENLTSLRLLTRARVIRGKSVGQLGQHKADIIFLDPPYNDPEEYQRCLEVLSAAATPAIVIAQHASREKVPEAVGALARYRVVKQGDNSLSFYRLSQS